MTTFSRLWRKLSESKRYREEFVANQVKRGIPFQIRTLMKQHRLSQEKLAEQAGLSQGVVSRAANPDYGNLTLNTIIRIAAGFDVAFVGKFVPFSELGRWYLSFSEEAMRVPKFADDHITPVVYSDQSFGGVLTPLRAPDQSVRSVKLWSQRRVGGKYTAANVNEIKCAVSVKPASTLEKRDDLNLIPPGKASPNWEPGRMANA